VPESDNPTPDIRSLRERAEQASELETQLADAQRLLGERDRQLAFARAGIDTGSKLGAMLFRTYEGEIDLTNEATINALREEAAEIGLGQGMAGAAGMDDELRQQADTRRLLGAGAPAPTADDGPDPTDLALRTFHEDVAGGMREDRARLKAVSSVIEAAGYGDKRVIFDEEAWLAAFR
jgi:hypothetical protein